MLSAEFIVGDVGEMRFRSILRSLCPKNIGGLD